MVVGDDDQSIYGWRGADIRNILDFEKSFPGARVVRLEQNYRSTPVILDAANRVIRQNCDRKEKTLRTDRTGGAPVTCLEAGDEGDEARWIVEEIERRMLSHAEYDHRDFACSTGRMPNPARSRDRFRRRGLPYQIVGGVRFYERREIQDVLAYLRLIANPRDADAFRPCGELSPPRCGTYLSDEVFRFRRRVGDRPLQAAARADEIPGLSLSAPGG